MVKRRLCIVGVLFVMLAMVGPVYAVPPTQIRGIDVSTVVAMLDHARQTEMRLKLSRDTKSFQTIKTIVIDPGHGGENQGALGVANIHEKFLTLELAYDLREKLQREYPDVRVVMTRYWDKSVGLQERVHYANEVHADLFISLHYNAAVHKRAVGFETYYLVTSEATPGQEEKKGEPIATASMDVTGFKSDLNQKPEATPANDIMSRMQRDLDRQRLHQECGLLARKVNQGLAGKLKSINRGVKQANFAVLRGANMPAIVVESGFVTHPKEGKKLITDIHRSEIAEALVSSIAEFDQARVLRD